MTAEFATLLKGYDLDAFDEHEATIFGLDEDLNVGYYNAAWIEFASNNLGTAELVEPAGVLGHSVLDSITGPLRSYYENAYHYVLNNQKPWHHSYDCSSLTEIRFYHIDVLPLFDEHTGRKGLLVINSDTEPFGPFPLRSPSPEPEPEHYIGEGELITQCSHCRRFRRVDRPDQWDWIPSYVNNPPRPISHGLCVVCLEYYYPSAGNDLSKPPPK